MRILAGKSEPTKPRPAVSRGDDQPPRGVGMTADVAVSEFDQN
jgi:hypothetical protein